jgi:hypothetical protein
VSRSLTPPLQGVHCRLCNMLTMWLIELHMLMHKYQPSTAAPHKSEPQTCSSHTQYVCLRARHTGPVVQQHTLLTRHHVPRSHQASHRYKYSSQN